MSSFTSGRRKMPPILCLFLVLISAATVYFFLIGSSISQQGELLPATVNTTKVDVSAKEMFTSETYIEAVLSGEQISLQRWQRPSSFLKPPMTSRLEGTYATLWLQQVHSWFDADTDRIAEFVSESKVAGEALRGSKRQDRKVLTMWYLLTIQ